MKNFVVSLKSALDRRDHVASQFNKENVQFSFFDAIEPHQIGLIAENLEINIHGSNLSKGEIGCLLSHAALWKKALDENIDYIGIFEDDIYLGEQAKDFLSNEKWIKDKWNIIKIERNLKYNYLSLRDRERISNDRILSKLLSANFGTAGYILSKKGALSLLKYVQQLEIVDHVDQIMFKHYLNTGEYSIYQLNPALCIQDYILFPENKKFESSLSWRKDNEKLQFGIFAKMNRELTRILLQIVFLHKNLSRKEVKFK